MTCWAVVSVLARNNIWCSVRVLLVVSIAMSCPIKQHHGRYSQDAAKVKAHRNLERDAINPIRFWKRAT